MGAEKIERIIADTSNFFVKVAAAPPGPWGASLYSANRQNRHERNNSTRPDGGELR
jgi:hypothetical protein